MHLVLNSESGITLNMKSKRKILIKLHWFISSRGFEENKSSSLFCGIYSL